MTHVIWIASLVASFFWIDTLHEFDQDCFTCIWIVFAFYYVFGHLLGGDD